jgi:hypothetical protein
MGKTTHSQLVMCPYLWQVVSVRHWNVWLTRGWCGCWKAKTSFVMPIVVLIATSQCRTTQYSFSSKSKMLASYSSTLPLSFLIYKELVTERCLWNFLSAWLMEAKGLLPLFPSSILYHCQFWFLQGNSMSHPLLQENWVIKGTVLTVHFTC